MPLKKKTVKKVGYTGKEGKSLQLDEVMSLFETAKLPAVTLHASQFSFPKTFLVRSAKRVAENIKNQETGWDLRDSAGNKKPTGNYFVRVELADGDAAQVLVDQGNSLSGLNTIQCTIKKDIPLQNLVPDETLLELVNPVVMLGFGGQQADRIVLLAEDCKEV